MKPGCRVYRHVLTGSDRNFDQVDLQPLTAVRVNARPLRATRNQPCPPLLSTKQEVIEWLVKRLITSQQQGRVREDAEALVNDLKRWKKDGTHTAVIELFERVYGKIPFPDPFYYAREDGDGG